MSTLRPRIPLAVRPHPATRWLLAPALLLAAAAPAQTRQEAGPAKKPASPVPVQGETPHQGEGDNTAEQPRIPQWQEDPLGLPADAPVRPPTGPWDALRPFRKPTQQVPPPDRVYAALRLMADTARRHPELVRYDEAGREVVDHPDWQAAYDRLQNMDDPASIAASPGYLVQIIRDSAMADDRRIAFFGSFYFNLPTWVIQSINHIPGEPSSGIRAEMLPRAIAYLRAQLSRTWGDLTEQEQAVVATYRTTAEVREGGQLPQDRLAFAPELDPRPFLATWDTGDDIATAQSLWFFKELAATHPELVRVWLFRQGERVAALALHNDQQVRLQAIGLLAELSGVAAPKGEAMADPAARQAWVDKAMAAAFPPAPGIDEISPGLFMLRASPELDQLVAVGRDVLERGALGEPVSGKDKEGWRYWGLEIRRMDPVLKVLGIPERAVLTAVNGRPVRREEELLKVLQQETRAKTTLILEWVYKKERRATEFRLRL